ncbi:MAG: 2Fe-2S iron-sulfur cluster binding domain-containing protein [Spirochaetaceae bacterium]|jgi:carbon-monoxide dehydrogenase small subunit|nr:2Fe-2S iron-sulfur cluster binding domain-containing protein [Spirochaetaceae bacterium]
MKIPLTLNGEPRTIEALADTKLMEALRKEACVDVKCGCCRGLCGACAVLLNDAPVPSCIVPAAAARNCSVVTLSHFKTLPVYDDIDQAFRQAGVELCGYCDAGKIFAVYSLVTRQELPKREEILPALASLECRCVDENLLANAVIYARALRTRREKKDKNVR